ncbi:MAG: hypothetical protein WBF43_11380 [Methylocella sp.]
MAEPVGTPRHILDRFAKHATAIGHLVYASARLQWSLAHLFAALVGPTEQSLPLTIWESLKSDSNKRNMLRDSAKLVLANRSNILDDVLWLLGKADTLATDRNDAVHTAFFFTTRDDGEIVPVPDPMSNPKRLKRLDDKNRPEMFAMHRDNLTMLYRYADTLTDYLLLDDHERPPFPQKPQLRSRGSA